MPFGAVVPAAMLCASIISATSLYVLAAVKTASLPNDHESWSDPPSSTTLTPTVPPLATARCCQFEARTPASLVAGATAVVATIADCLALQRALLADVAGALVAVRPARAETTNRVP